MVASSHIAALIRLVRLPNLVIIAVTQVLIRYCVIGPLLSQARMELQLTGFQFTVLVLATVLTAAAGYVINDYFDRKIDRLNKPGEVIVGRKIFPRHAMAYHLVFSITGALAGTWLSFRTGEPYLSLIYFMVSGLLWFYSTTYKRQLLLGNVIVSLLTALVPFMVLVYELPLLASAYGTPARNMADLLIIWVTGFSGFAFLINLVREIVKDAEDVDGDRRYGKKTIPVEWGLPAARRIAFSLLVVLLALLFLAWLLFVPDYYSLTYFILLIALPVITVMVLVLRKDDKASLHRASLLLKVTMVAGLLYMVAVRFILQILS